MQTILMAIAIIEDSNKRLLLRKTDPSKNPYREPWALFGGRIEGDGTVTDLLNNELLQRWNFTVSITEKLWWDEDIKIDHDGEKKRFVYIDALCTIIDGNPAPLNKNEELHWVALRDLGDYALNPPTRVLLGRLGYIES